MTVSLSLLAIALIYWAFIAIALFVDSKFNHDKFSAVKLACYFSAIEAFVLTWFSVRTDSLRNVVLASISSSHGDPTYTSMAYLLSVYIFSSTLFGAVIGSVAKSSAQAFIYKSLLCIPSVDRLATLSKSAVLYFIGVAIYFIFTIRIGGLPALWENIALRTQLTAGQGYLQATYVFLITISTVFLYVALIRRKHYILIFLIAILSIFILASLGQRAPVAVLIFSIFLVHHYHIKKFKRIFSVKILAVSAILIAFMFSFAQLRPSQTDVNFIHAFERDVLQRLANVERQVVTLSYFDKNSFWGFGLYQSLIYAPLPRTIMEEKPPVDTGVYLHYVSKGYQVTPPVPAAHMEPTSWPEGALAGYMSAGLVGLTFVTLISGYIFGSIYRLARRHPNNMSPTFLYSLTAYMGVLQLSPYGLVQLLLMIIPLFILGLAARVTHSSLRALRRTHPFRANSA